MSGNLWEKLNPNNVETKINNDDALEYKDNWKANHVGKQQRVFVDEELKQFKNGQTPYVYNGFLQLLNLIEGDNLSFLDVGCASGYYYEVANHQYPGKIKYNGCDYNQDSIKIAKEHYPDIPFTVEDITQLTFTDKQFDVVMVSGVLEHVPEQNKAFDEMCRVTKDWLICHRVGLTTQEEHFTKGSQYKTPVVRYYFNKEKFVKRIVDRGFVFKSYINVYPNNENIQSFLFKRT